MSKISNFFLRIWISRDLISNPLSHFPSEITWVVPTTSILHASAISSNCSFWKVSNDVGEWGATLQKIHAFNFFFIFLYLLDFSFHLNTWKLIIKVAKIFNNFLQMFLNLIFRYVTVFLGKSRIRDISLMLYS